MRKILLVVIPLVLVLGGAAVWALVANTPPSRRTSEKKTPEQQGGLELPSFHSEHVLAQAESVVPHPTPPEIVQVSLPPQSASEGLKKLAPMRIYTSTAAVPEPTPEATPQGDYAPAFRLVRCKLFNTVDSASITTPIMGLVTDDLVWNGKVIIAKCSEVHGIAQVDKSKERIAAEGAWTFILYDQDNPGLGRELVLRGYAMDREDDPEFKKLMVGSVVVDPAVRTWGITDGSAGLRGGVIRSNNAQALQLFVATFMAGIAQSVQGSVTNVFGETVPSPNVSGAGGVPGYIINPPAQGAEAVLDRYAQMVMDSIEKDGFFIRVPAGKLFYVYVTEDILTSKATVGGSRRLVDVQTEFLEDRAIQERVTQPRADRDARAAQEGRNGGVGNPIDPALTHRLDNASAALEARSQALQQRSDQLQQLTTLPTPTPVPTPVPTP